IGTLSLGATNSCSLTLGGTLTLDDAGTLSGNLTIGANGTLNAAGYAISLDGNWSNSGTFNHGNNTVTFTKAAGTQTLDSGGTGAGKTFYDFVFSGAGTLQPVTNHIKVDHNLTFNAGAGAFDNATNDKAISVTGDVTMDNTRVDMGDATWTVSGNWDSAGVTTFNRNESTLTLNGTDKLFTATATMQFRHINVEGTISIGSDIQIKGIATVSGIVTIPSGLAFTLNTSNAELKITENGQIVGQGFVWLSDGVVVTQQDGIFNPSTAVVTRGITLVGATYGGDWTFFHSTTSDKTITFGTAAGQTVIFTGSVTINNNNASGAYTIVNGTYNPNLVFQGGLTLTESAGAITWTKGSGTITLGNNPSDGTQTINFGDKIIEDLIIDASGDIKQLSDGVTTDSLTVTAGTLDVNNQALSVTGNLLVNGGTLDASGASSDLDINGNVQVISGTLSAPAAADDTSFTVGGNWEVSGAGIFTPNAGRVVFDAGDSDNTIITTSAGADDFYDAKFNNILGTWILEDDLTITNDLSIATGTLDVKTGENNSLTVGGDWANTGTFLARNGTVTFNGAGVSILSGSTSFYNFNSSIAGKTLSFTRGTTQTITNDLTLNGSSSNMLIVNDTGAGSVPQLTLQAGAAQNITNVSVTNNDASGGLMLSVQGTSLLSGVTTNWALASSGDSQVSPLTSVSAQSVLRQAEGILYRMPRMTNPFICSDYSFGSPFFIFPAFRLPFLEINYKNLR
ncbi:MAG: hypothetical protein KKF80_02100, partial [Candidatus Omnitrophica bacterium]|nr:hypothetical protein [Candidatus Omnitrophota bacterium]